jgi:hypothetical protein
LDEATANWIEKEAERRGTNKETVALQLIQKGIECEGEYDSLRTYDDLDSLAGTWTEEQATEFMDAISHFDQVDEKIWQ